MDANRTDVIVGRGRNKKNQALFCRDFSILELFVGFLPYLLGLGSVVEIVLVHVGQEPPNTNEHGPAASPRPIGRRGKDYLAGLRLL